MQFKFITLTTLALATFAAATPTPAPRQDGQCSTGEIQCCQSTSTASDPLVSVILSLLGIIVLPDITAIIGINCSPLSVIGVGGSQCQSNPVCCEDNSVGGLISIGCVPVNL